MKRRKTTNSTLNTKHQMLSILFHVLINYIIFLYASLSSEIQEKYELYMIASKLIIEQFILKFNPLAALLLTIQLISVFVISAVLFMRLKSRSKTTKTKKIKIYCGVRMEEIEMVRIIRRNSSIKPKVDKQNSITTSDTNINRLSQNPYSVKLKEDSYFTHEPLENQKISKASTQHN